MALRLRDRHDLIWQSSKILIVFNTLEIWNVLKQVF